jgi:hypothetical protein
VALIDEPRLLEVVRADGSGSLAHLLEAVVPGALASAEAHQASTGGSNPRFGPIFDEPADGDLPPAAATSCAVVADDPAMAAAVTAALEARGVTCHAVQTGAVAAGFAAAADALACAVEQAGPFDAVVVALAGPSPVTASSNAWERVLAEHAGIVGQLRTDAAWSRAVAAYAAQAERPVRLVTLTDAVTAGGRSRAQASAQLARAARRATDDRVAAFAVSVEADAAVGATAAGELAAHLVSSPEAPALSGAELVAGPGWFGLRSHPRPSGSITFGGPELPAWFDSTLRSLAGAPAPADEEPT